MEEQLQDIVDNVLKMRPPAVTPIDEKLEEFNTLCDQIEAVDANLKALKKKKDSLSRELADDFETLKYDGIKRWGFNFYNQTVYTCSAKGVQIEDAQVWGDEGGHDDVVKFQIVSSRFKSLAIEHMYGDPEEASQEKPYLGDGKVPPGTKLDCFTKLVRRR